MSLEIRDLFETLFSECRGRGQTQSYALKVNKFFNYFVHEELEEASFEYWILNSEKGKFVKNLVKIVKWHQAVHYLSAMGKMIKTKGKAKKTCESQRSTCGVFNWGVF